MQWQYPSSLSTKKLKVTSTPSAGKFMLTVFWDSQGVLLTHFQKYGENVNSLLYCEILLKPRIAIRRKFPGQLAREVLILHHNVRPHTVPATQERIQELQWELLEHPSYITDLAPGYFDLFGPLRNNLGGKRFPDDEEVEMEMQNS
jgi:hypothetical protein